jgi:hypothetical protein
MPVAHGADIWLTALPWPSRGEGSTALAFAVPHLHRPVVDGELATAA